MSTQEFTPYKRRWSSLSIRIAFSLIGAAFIPLVVVIMYVFLQTNPALINQANAAMKSDAETRVQLIDTYFRERLLDAETLTQIPSVQSFLVSTDLPGTPAYQESALHAGYSLGAGQFRDKNYATWTLFDANAQIRLSYPTNIQPQKHGQSLVPPDLLDKVKAGKSFISPLYYSSVDQKATVDIYAPIFMPVANTGVQASAPRIIGFMRATLHLDYIWNDIVQKDLGNNGTGSYAFILDENGVRIADTNLQERFTSVNTLPTAVQQRISQEARYGSTAPVSLLKDDALTEHLTDNTASTTFQAQPTGQKEQFQIVRRAITSMPWNYYVLSPESTETAVANQQQISTIIVAFIATFCVTIIGLFVGRGISRPILRSVEDLRGNSVALSALATSQGDAAAEQLWVVESSQVGLQSVQYYTEATKKASGQLRETATQLIEHWNEINHRQILSMLKHIIKAANYIENATEYQDASNQKLATALKVAIQVTEQLNMGATSATEAAAKLEQVVRDLRSVVKK